jgi:hypothetical protein
MGEGVKAAIFAIGGTVALVVGLAIFNGKADSGPPVKHVAITGRIAPEEAAHIHDYLTGPHALVCTTRLKLEEAVAGAANESWLRSIGCFYAKQGLAARRIDEYGATHRDYHWKIRLNPQGDGMTVWTNKLTLTTTDGREVR